MAEMSPVETLRAAAALLREHGEAAVTEAPWRVVIDESAEDDTAVGVWSPEEMFVFEDSDTMRVDAEWIALVHPGVAEPWAAMFDRFAWLLKFDADLIHRVGTEEVLAVARVLLGVPDGPA